jgi:hypothetical protein
MAGVTADEGAKVIADLLYLGSNADRGTSLQLGLFTNSVPIGTLKALPLTSITEPAGGGYARKTLTNASWTRAVGTSSYALQSFVVGAGGYTGNVYGYFIATTGTTPRLLHIEIDPLGPYVLANGDHYDVTANTITA